MRGASVPFLGEATAGIAGRLGPAFVTRAGCRAVTFACSIFFLPRLPSLSGERPGSATIVRHAHDDRLCAIPQFGGTREAHRRANERTVAGPMIPWLTIRQCDTSLTSGAAARPGDAPAGAARALEAVRATAPRATIPRRKHYSRDLRMINKSPSRCRPHLHRVMVTK